jgi:hypothetical protein
MRHKIVHDYLSVEPRLGARPFSPGGAFSEYNLFVPAPAAEQQHGHYREDGFGDRYRQEHPLGSHAGCARQRPGQRDLEQPETEQVDYGGRPGVTRAVVGLHHHHAPGVEQVTKCQIAQAVGARLQHRRVGGEQADQPVRDHHENSAGHTQEQHVVETGQPDRAFGAVGFPGPQVLAHQRRRRVAQPPRRHDREYDDANRDRVARHRSAGEHSDDAHQPDPACGGDEGLEKPVRRDADQLPGNGRIEPQVLAVNSHSPAPPRQQDKLIRNARAAPVKEARSTGASDHSMYLFRTMVQSSSYTKSKPRTVA